MSGPELVAWLLDAPPGTLVPVATVLPLLPPPGTPAEPGRLTLAQVAERIAARWGRAVKVATVRKYIRSGRNGIRLRASRVGGPVHLVAEPDLEAWFVAVEAADRAAAAAREMGTFAAPAGPSPEEEMARAEAATRRGGRS